MNISKYGAGSPKKPQPRPRPHPGQPASESRQVELAGVQGLAPALPAPAPPCSDDGPRQNKGCGLWGEGEAERAAWGQVRALVLVGEPSPSPCPGARGL